MAWENVPETLWLLAKWSIRQPNCFNCRTQVIMRESAWIIKPDNDKMEALLVFFIIPCPLRIYLILNVGYLRVGKNLKPWLRAEIFANRYQLVFFQKLFGCRHQFELAINDLVKIIISGFYGKPADLYPVSRIISPARRAGNVDMDVFTNQVYYANKNQERNMFIKTVFLKHFFEEMQILKFNNMIKWNELIKNKIIF